ncbi:hypothetical protein LTR51_008654 [Lithohypha guttulata]|nr:hypothetical protein LTR51_008654 [Lithohypha guttulata]
MQEHHDGSVNGTESALDIANLPTGDRDGDAAILNAVLGTIRVILKSDRELHRRVPYSISTRAQREQSNPGPLMSYEGPEEETVAELASNHCSWLHNPASFWQTQATPDFDQLMPEAQMVGLFMVRDRSDK